MPYINPMRKRLHTVAETEPFIVSAAKAGMTDWEREAAIRQVASDPSAGDLIVGSGGVRRSVWPVVGSVNQAAIALLLAI